MSRRRRDRWVWRRLREAVRDNQWLLPAVGAVGGLVVALIVGTGDGAETYGWTVTVDRSRDTLISTLGLVFTALSIVLALASVAAQNVVGRFGSRVLRIHTRSSDIRWLVAVFAFTAAFILTAQFQLRELDPDGPAPVVALTISVLLLVVSGSTLIWYIASVIRSFRVDQAVVAITANVRHALGAVERQRAGTARLVFPERPDAAIRIVSPRSGHLAEFDTDSMLESAIELDAMVAITLPLGTSVVERESVGWMHSPTTELGMPYRVAEQIDISGTRELSLAVEYGLFALVDIAIIALSPAVNDPNSAVEVIEEMSFLFPEIAKVPLGPYAVPDADAWPRVVVMARSFGELVELATTQIVLYGIDDPNVAKALRRFAGSLDLLELDDTDQRYVDEFAAKLAAGPNHDRPDR